MNRNDTPVCCSTVPVKLVAARFPVTETTAAGAPSLVPIRHRLLTPLTAPNAFADAMDDWVAYRTKQNLPVYPVPTSSGFGNHATMPAWTGDANNTWVHYRRSQNQPIEVVSR